MELPPTAGPGPFLRIHLGRELELADPGLGQKYSPIIHKRPARPVSGYRPETVAREITDAVQTAGHCASVGSGELGIGE